MSRVFCRASLVCLLFILVSTILYADPIFHSDFELGETHLAQAYTAGQQELVLIENDKLDEWMLTGGKGVIENAGSGETEHFLYERREGNVLYGVSGLTKNFSKFNKIIGGGIHEWYKIKPQPVNDLTVSNDKALFGYYSANINFHQSSILNVGKSISPTIKEFYIRFYVLFSEEMFQTELLDFHFFNVRYSNYCAPRLFLAKDGVNHYSIKAKNAIDNLKSQSKYRNIEKIDNVAFNILPDKKYCMEYYVKFATADSCQFSLSCNGVPIYNTSLKLKSFGHLVKYCFWIGKWNSDKLNGKMYIDEVVFDIEPIGTKPEQPTIVFSKDWLESSFFADVCSSESHAASHWQISESRNWIVLDYNSVEDSEGLTRLNLETLDLDIVRHKNYYARVRHKNIAGNWSDWSEPLKFKYQSSSNIINRTGIIKKAFFSMPGENRPVEYLQSEIWYDFHIHIKEKSALDNLKYVFFWFYTDSEHNIAFNIKSTGKFDSYRAYNFSLSLRTGRIWSKQTEGLPISTDIFNTEGFYVDNDINHLIISEDENWVIIRLKFLSQAINGLWVMEGYAATVNNERFLPYKDTFFIGTIPKIKSELPLTLVMTGFILLTGLVALYFLRSSKNGKNIKKIPKDIDAVDDFMIKNVVTYVKENMSNELHVYSIAREFKVSPSWLSTHFRKLTDEKLSSYINRNRINYAKVLLNDPYYSISEVALKAGFESYTSFFRVFKKIEKKSPKIYRKKLDS